MDIASTTEVGVEYIEYTGEVASINWDNATKAAATEKVTPWKVMITGLTADKQYAVRAYATTATGKIYGSIITFIATAPEPISIADLVTKIKATTTETLIDKDYVIQGIICGDPQSKNCSFGTLYLMTKGATTAGNAVTVYNTDIASETYSLGDEIKVILRKENTKMQVYNSSPPGSGFDPAEIEKISSNNEVIPVETTVDQLLDFVCMPVTIKNVTIEQAGTWKQEENKYVTHKFKVSGADLTVYINKGAEIFKDKPFAAKTGSITGIAAAYKTDAQILPRNLDDVKDFEITGPTIISVTPTQVNFPATGGEETVTVEISNQGSSTLQVAPLSGILSAEIGTGNTVKVKAEANTGSEVKQDLVISLSTGGSITVPIKVAGGNEEAKDYSSITPFIFGNGENKGNTYGEKVKIEGIEYDCIKLGKSKNCGVFKSGTLNVTGNYQLSFYAGAWKEKKATIYLKVEGGGEISGSNNAELTANTGISDSSPYTVTFADTDHYTFNLTGLTATSTIIISTSPNFSTTDTANPRALLCGFQLKQ